MYLEGTNCSLQVDVGGGALFVYAQPAVIIKGVGKFVARKLHLLGCADRAVSLSVMGNHHEAVFSFVQTHMGSSEPGVGRKLVRRLQFLLSVKDGKRQSGAHIAQSNLLVGCFGRQQIGVFYFLHMNRYIGVCIM